MFRELRRGITRGGIKEYMIRCVGGITWGRVGSVEAMVAICFLLAFEWFWIFIGTPETSKIHCRNRFWDHLASLNKQNKDVVVLMESLTIS